MSRHTIYTREWILSCGCLPSSDFVFFKSGPLWLADNQKGRKIIIMKETLETLPNISFHSQGRNIAVPSLAYLCKFRKDNFGQRFIWDKSEVLLKTSWRTHWEFGKHVGNSLGTWWECIGKLKGMIWNSLRTLKIWGPPNPPERGKIEHLGRMLHHLIVDSVKFLNTPAHAWEHRYLILPI
jgi:hypothetical protein